MAHATNSELPGARRPRRRPGENRAGLLAAGTIEFGLNGFAAAQTSAIASRAGVSQPNVYANFASKRELFVACLSEAITVLSASVIVDRSESGHTQAHGADDLSTAARDMAKLVLFQAFASLRDPQLTDELPERLNSFTADVGADRVATWLAEAAAGLLADSL